MVYEIGLTTLQMNTVEYCRTKHQYYSWSLVGNEAEFGKWNWSKFGHHNRQVLLAALKFQTLPDHAGKETVEIVPNKKQSGFKLFKLMVETIIQTQKKKFHALRRNIPW